MAEEKRVKTGGRPAKKSVIELIEETEARSRIAVLVDDTTLPAELAALYLCMSPSQLAIFHKEIEEGGSPDGPSIIKHIEKGAVGQNQPVRYKLGALRAWEKKHTSSTSFEAMKNAGMLGWISTPAPFFCKPAASGRKTQLALLAHAWDTSSPLREERFKGVVDGSVAVEWMTMAQAATSRWKSLSEHKAFAEPWLRLLRNETEGSAAAIEATEIGESIGDGPPPIIDTRRGL